MAQLTESFFTFFDLHQQVIFNLIVLVALISVIGHFLSPKHHQEKNEALKQVVLFGGMLLVLQFTITVVTSLGQVTNSGRSTLANVFALCLAIYWLLYTMQVKAKKDGKPAFRTKVYRQLAELEAWLDEKGKQGILLESGSPDYFSFHLIQTDCVYHYKAAYFPSSNIKEMRAFVAENQREGWEFVRASLSSTYADQPEKTIGLNSIAIFKSRDLSLSKGEPSRFNYQQLTRNIGKTIVLNLLVLVGAIAATWYFSEVQLLLNATVLIGFAVFMQLFMYAYLRHNVQSNFQASGRQHLK